jgi:signal transduction histidine kinase
MGPMEDSSRRALLLPTAIALVAAGAVVLLWQALRDDHVERVANVTEATSYATRSELARRLTVQFDSLQALATLWLTAAAQSDAAAPLGLIRFEGVDIVAWSGGDGTRFAATSSDPVASHAPTAAEWAAIEPFVAEARAAATVATAGPFTDADGHATFRYYVPARRGDEHGVLIASIDAHDLLAALLVDEALGYEIRVTCCGGRELYQRGSAAEDLPGAWTRDGWIAPAPEIRWNVRHRPSPELRADLDTSAADSVLIVGLALALLLGGLVFETRRANDRAGAANQAEQRIRRLNRELEERVLTRTQKLGDVLRDLNTINLSVSHDLRSPLNAISLVVGQMQVGNPDEATAGRLDRIAVNVARMATIIDRLLGFARISSFESERETVDMRALAEQIVREQGLSAKTVSIGALPPAPADKMLVHILLSNLVANAVKHGRGIRPPRIEIGSRQTAAGITAYFVRDNGSGLDPSLAEKLFKPLPDRPPSSGSGGLGLGLAIAARAVERHGGRICVESDRGQGTTFLFTLEPDLPSDAAADRTASSPLPES